MSPDVRLFVEEALGVEVGGVEGLLCGLQHMAYVVHLAAAPAPERTGGVACGAGTDLVFSVDWHQARPRAGLLSTLAPRLPVAVPTLVASGVFGESRDGESPPPWYTLVTRAPGVPLSSVWASCPPPHRLSYLRQLLAITRRMAEVKYSAPGALNDAGDLDVSGSPVHAPGGLAAVYRADVTARMRRLGAHPRAALFAAIGPLLERFRDTALPALCDGYTGGFSLCHPRLRLRHVLVDPSTATVTGLLGLHHAQSRCDGDGPAAVLALADTDADAAALQAELGGAAPDPMDTVRRVLALCDRCAEFRTWYAMKAPAAEQFLADSVVALGELLAPYQ